MLPLPVVCHGTDGTRFILRGESADALASLLLNALGGTPQAASEGVSQADLSSLISSDPFFARWVMELGNSLGQKLSTATQAAEFLRQSSLEQLVHLLGRTQRTALSSDELDAWRAELRTRTCAVQLVREYFDALNDAPHAETFIFDALVSPANDAEDGTALLAFGRQFERHSGDFERHVTTRCQAANEHAAAIARESSPVPQGPARYLSALISAGGEILSSRANFDRQLEQEKLASLAEFAAGAGHEINNPLAVISGRAQLLLRGETDPERQRELAVISLQAHRVSEMIADLMAFARPPQPTLRKLELIGTIEKGLRELQSLAERQKCALIGPGNPREIQILADENQLIVAVKSVCKNAILAAPGGTVRVTCGETEDRIARIEITDDGPGIPPEIRRHLFDPFYSGRTAGRGLGMGLAKCWRIMQMHGGSISVDSPGEQGTRVRLEIPLAEPESREPPMS